MENYQRAAQSLRSGEEAPLNLLKNVGLSALGGGAAAAGSRALGRVLPAVGALINKYVPENLSISGLSKVDPRFNKFIKGALDEGYSYEDVRKFMGEKIEKSQAPEDKRSVIEKYSPELHQFIEQEIKKGRPPLHAAAVATTERKFADAIKKLTKDHKADLGTIVESVFGNSQKAPTTSEEQQTEQPQQNGIGPGMQKLMQLLQQRQR